MHQVCGFLLRKRITVIKITNLVLILLQLSSSLAIPFLYEDMVVFSLLVLSLRSPSAGRLLPGLRAPFIFPPPMRHTFTAGGVFEAKKKTGKPKPRLLCQCDNYKHVTLDLLINPFPCVWWITWHAGIQIEWADAVICRWASSPPRVGV